MYSCGNEIESTTHYFLNCVNFSTQKADLLEQTRYSSLTSKIEKFLFGKPDFHEFFNKQIINVTINLLEQPSG